MKFGISLTTILLTLSRAVGAEEHQAVSEFKSENSGWVEISYHKEFSVTLSCFIAKAEDKYRVLVFRAGNNGKPPLIWRVDYEESRRLAYAHSQRAYQNLANLLTAPPERKSGLGGTWVSIDGGEAKAPHGRTTFWREGINAEARELVDQVLHHFSRLTGVSLIADFRVHYPNEGAEQDAARKPSTAVPE